MMRLNNMYKTGIKIFMHYWKMSPMLNGLIKNLRENIDVDFNYTDFKIQFAQTLIGCLYKESAIFFVVSIS